MAEFVMKDLVQKRGLTADFVIASAATSTEELGNPVYPPVRRLLEEHGISCEGKRARQITKNDYRAFDLIIGMDMANIRNMRRVFDDDPENKVHLLLDYTDTPGEVADPWYSDDFARTWREVQAGCQGLLENILSH